MYFINEMKMKRKMDYNKKRASTENARLSFSTNLNGTQQCAIVNALIFCLDIS